MIEALRAHRYLIARRITQAGVIALFALGFRLDWTLGGRELVAGDLSASRVLDAVPLADPFAVVQMLAAGQALLWDVLLGAGIVAGFYWLVGGRAFCAWVCPLNPVTDAAGWLRARLGIPAGFSMDRRLRFAVLALALVLSALTGIAAFEWVSPIGMVHRELIYGLGLGWMAVAGVFLFDLLVLRHGWCGHLCPLGAFYGLLGRFSALRVGFVPERCTRCGECHRVCPEPHVLNLRGIAAGRLVGSGDCSNCGRCIEVCPEACLGFAARWRPPAPPPRLESEAGTLGAAHVRKAS